jgi:hypothetical protein
VYEVTLLDWSQLLLLRMVLVSLSAHGAQVAPSAGPLGGANLLFVVCNLKEVILGPSIHMQA